MLGVIDTLFLPAVKCLLLWVIQSPNLLLKVYLLESLLCAYFCSLYSLKQKPEATVFCAIALSSCENPGNGSKKHDSQVGKEGKSMSGSCWYMQVIASTYGTVLWEVIYTECQEISPREKRKDLTISSQLPLDKCSPHRNLIPHTCRLYMHEHWIGLPWCPKSHGVQLGDKLIWCDQDWGVFQNERTWGSAQRKKAKGKRGHNGHPAQVWGERYLNRDVIRLCLCVVNQRSGHLGGS